MDRSNFINLFLEWNEKLNLSAIRDYEGVYNKHVLDSLHLNECIKLNIGSELIDLGTGGGFPLLPLAITNPNVNFTGIDARRKKVDAINQMISTLGISNVKAIWGRGEELKGQYDYLTARAVGYIDKLFEYGYHLVRKGGYFLIYKMYSEDESKDIMKFCKKYDLKIVKKYEYKLDGDDVQRLIYVIRK